MPTYKHRHIEPLLKLCCESSPVVILTGARQVGKSTLAKKLFPDRRIVEFEKDRDLHGARKDPELFLDAFPPPLILDEMQFAPQLLPAIKKRSDDSAAPGMYLLTGSQCLPMMKGVSESLAGRAASLTLNAMTIQEETGDGSRPTMLEIYLDNPAALHKRHAGIMDAGTLHHAIWKGGMPGLIGKSERFTPIYHHSYVQTYLERDIRAMMEIRDMRAFDVFIGLSAALTAQEVNMQKMGSESGVTMPTAKSWLSLLSATHQWIEIPPYHGNAVKRMTGRCKGHFADTGLACHLQRISSPQALAVSPLRGAMFETWVVTQLLRQACSLDTPPSFHHWREHGGAEVDLVLERDGILYPIEVKCKSDVSPADAKNINTFKETFGADKVAHGLIFYAGSDCKRVIESATAVPWNSKFK